MDCHARRNSRQRSRWDDETHLKSAETHTAHMNVRDGPQGVGASVISVKRCIDVAGTFWNFG